MTLEPAICRIDLLESAPGAADRMHWHPVMAAGEPDDQVFDTAMPADPLAWLSERLLHFDDVLAQAGVPDTQQHSTDVAAVAQRAPEIVASACDGLAWAVARGHARRARHGDGGIGAPRRREALTWAVMQRAARAPRRRNGGMGL